MVAAPCPRRRRAGNARGRCGDRRRAAAACPACPANSHSRRLNAGFHTAVDVAARIDCPADHHRAACSRPTGHGEYLRHPDTVGDTVHRDAGAAGPRTDDDCQRGTGADAPATHHTSAHQCQPRIAHAVSKRDCAQEGRSRRRVARRTSLAGGQRHEFCRNNTAFGARQPADLADILPTAQWRGPNETADSLTKRVLCAPERSKPYPACASSPQCG